MKRETLRLLGIVQLVMEALIAIGYLLGLIPFVYAWSSTWVVPLAIISLIIALLTRNGTLLFAAVNVAIAFVSYIPIVGFVTRLAGAIVSLINITRIRRQL